VGRSDGLLTTTGLVSFNDHGAYGMLALFCKASWIVYLCGVAPRGLVTAVNLMLTGRSCIMRGLCLLSEQSGALSPAQSARWLFSTTHFTRNSFGGAIPVLSHSLTKNEFARQLLWPHSNADTTFCPTLAMSSLSGRDLEDQYDYLVWELSNVSRYEEFSRQPSDADALNQIEGSLWPLPLRQNNLAGQELNSAAIIGLQDKNGKTCYRCRKIDFERMEEDLRDTHRSTYILGPFESIVENSQCLICCQLRQLAREYTNTRREVNTVFYLTAFPTSALYASEWTWSDTPGGVSQTVSYSIMDEVTLNDLSGSQQSVLLRAIGCISPILEVDSHETFHARRLGENLDVKVVRAWLNYCNHNHLRSCASTESPLHPFTKVINCHTGDMVPLEFGNTYLALSYVWGSQEAYERHEDRDFGLSRSKTTFPPTISDAIELTKALGYTYLWVDRFCIVGDIQERRLQIAQMDRIYAGAEATIIAAAGGSPNHGLPGISKRTSYQQGCSMINGQLHAVIPPDPALEIKASKWNSRAWTYQETILSKRRIIFCERQVYFECSGMHCYEAMQAPLHRLHNPLASCFSEWNEPGLFPVSKHRHALDQLFRHLALYTSRNLSFPGDILNGMLGIFSAFRQQAVAAKSSRSSRRVLQMAGIPIVPNDDLNTYNPIDPSIADMSREQQFLTGLGWNLSKPAQRRAGFPSWSWTGWYGTVLPRKHYAGYIWNTHSLDLKFKVPDRPDPVNLDTILHMSQEEEIGPDFLPQITATGNTVSITVTYPDNHRAGENPPKSFLAFISSDNAEGYIRSDNFTLTYEHPRMITSVFREDCIGLILGMATYTYFEGKGDLRTRVLVDDKFVLVIMALRECNGVWERLGFIDHIVPIRTDSCPIPVNSGYMALKTERRRLQLG
jgi:hypothetical protein